ncbi:MAG TPA: DUF4233 domain-containing protein [Kineosporiaceae bacterium]
MRSPLRTLAATMLVLEAFVLFFATLVAKDLSGIGPGPALGGGGGLALACLLAAGLARFRAGLAVGWALQLVMIGTGFVVPMMFGIGLLFTGLWAAALFVGTKIERERAYVARVLAARQTAPDDPTAPPEG